MRRDFKIKLKKLKERMKMNQFEDKTKTRTIKDYIEGQGAINKYLLDDENAIIRIKNNDETSDRQPFIMIHKRLIDGKLSEVNRWYINSYYLNPISGEEVIKDLNLFKIQNDMDGYDALYDYKKCRFVVPKGEWDLLEFGNHNQFVEQYNGILASFSVSSDYAEDDVISYTNILTQEKIVESFVVKDGKYYAILNADGSIRANKLFKGNEFSKIESIIDLSEYASLAEFKRERKEFCNKRNIAKKQEYYKTIASRNDGSISPYLDREVAQILELRKK